VTYLATVLADAPVHYWRLADAAPLFLHDIGSSPLHLGGGTLGGMPWSGIAADGGSLDVAGNLGGLYLEAITQARPLSIEFWLYVPWLSGNLESLFYWDGNVANNVFCYMDATGHINLGGTGVTLLTMAAAITRQAWHHVVGSFNNGATILFVDGVNVANNLTQVTTPVNRPLALGMATGSTQALHGFITEAAVYGVALTLAQVQAHFNAQELTSPPVYLGGGNPNNPSYGSSTQPTPLNDLVLQSVRKTY
jgi:Concanavalin A-like lectin/glucanases superfamily